VARHGWDAVDHKVVYHPSKTGRRIVGNVFEHLGEDIGLLDCIMPFLNEFPDLGIQAKSFLQSTQIKYNEYVVIDSCFTGVQKLHALGVRTGASLQSLQANNQLLDHYEITIISKSCKEYTGSNPQSSPENPPSVKEFLGLY
jgi:hypothetical protein